MRNMREVDSQEIVNYINNYWRDHEYGPMLDEIAEHFDVSKSSAARRVNAMIRDGLAIWPKDWKGRHITRQLRTQQVVTLTPLQSLRPYLREMEHA